jgi:hypothetical protein
VIYMRYLGLRLAAFCLGALVAAAYYPLVFLFGAIDHDLWPFALAAHIMLVFGALIWIRQANLSYIWPALGVPVGVVAGWIVGFIILVSIYGFHNE